MTLYAVFSDIHANYAALLAAVRDARALARHEHDGELEFISLGDVVDYGPQPNECVAWVQRYATIAIQGNHDRVAAEPLTRPPLEIDRYLWPIALWTRAELHDHHKQTLSRWRSQPGDSTLLSAFTPFHSDLQESDTYLNTPRSARRTLELLKTPYGLFGHTHVQGYYMLAGRDVKAGLAGPVDMAPVEARLTEELVPINQWRQLPTAGERVILNPGSLGQPRQPVWYGAAHTRRDYRAAYMLLRKRPKQDWEVRFQRVDYPVMKTIQLLRQQVQWDRHRSRIEAALASQHVSASEHPFAKRLIETLASMDTLLPTVVEFLVQQLMPADTE